ncbi:disease resistance protein (NBS-LRR class) family protein [Medicago truncatula]|uniref:Disease resistance protein (NBS-LRR class) family protein n=1 Tax=Medicago truncatula TaxID=3880 RepID=A0A072U6B6_MEDTR|nr:disease resistance protein (NBS-LRR class) family protein [Medicago truncatula]
MEDVGNEFVNTRLKKSFFLDEKFDKYGNLVSFKMHELMHDLALLVAHNDFYLDSVKRVANILHTVETWHGEYTDCGEAKLQDLIGRLHHLRYLDLSWCARLESLPKSIRNLVNLGNLEINGLDQVRDVRLESQDVNLMDKKFLESLDLNWDCRGKIEDTLQLLENLRPHQNLRRINVDDILVSSFLAATFFPTLERLSISSCDKLRGWKSKEDDVRSHHLSLPQFRCLSQLMIYGCPKLTCLPPFPNVKEFELCESTLKPLKDALDTSTTPLSMLKSLKIQGSNLEIDSLPSMFQYLTYYHLKRIEIVGCHYLKSLPRGISRLNNLVELKKWDCPLLGQCNCKCFTGEDLLRFLMSRTK